MGRLDGKVAFITGAARGQGRSHAVTMAKEGADIIAVDICAQIDTASYPLGTSAELAETARLVEALDRRVVTREADVRDLDALQKAVDEGVAELGHLDIVVANAGISVITAWDQITPQIWKDILDVNLTGVWHSARVAIPHLIANGSGSIILISSAAGLKAMPFLAPYVASKHGVTGLTRALALEMAEHDIRVNSIHPTGVDTPMGSHDDGGGAGMDELLALHPRVGGVYTNILDIRQVDPVDISHAVVYLASEEARYVTALAMAVDAGVTQY